MKPILLPPLSHYSEEACETIDLNRKYKHQTSFNKPEGLWVSVDSEYGWHAHCRDADFFPEGLTYGYKVQLKANANILVIDTAQKLIDFTEKYKEIKDRPVWAATISWDTVYCLYDGILISPYHYQIRLKYDWYYGFDCASGCIWNLSCIDDFAKDETYKAGNQNQ